MLPLVVRIERSHPPTRTDALEAAARAVLTILTNPEPEWEPALRAWDAARIRKVVRRARGADWRRADLLPGLGLRVRTAEVRVFPPVPVDDWPRDLARLQVSGTDLDDPAAAPAPDPATPVLWLNPALEMSAGKAMAQAGHAAQLGLRASPVTDRRRWAQQGFPLAVRTAAAERWDRLVDSGLPVVRDAGFTEVAPGSCTAVADLPWLVARPAAQVSVPPYEVDRTDAPKESDRHDG